ncbi:hypothetical protein E3N88_00706 [Mikania micrantha]|uniref:Uncharacterized protein n=1 Tax=Mikania micrantha TaxID=192012 RepID=A0A5N6Q1K1_9ASTR|nr:hypothetical protein E3N88_00706 [Mikania micrantha]
MSIKQQKKQSEANTSDERKGKSRKSSEAKKASEAHAKVASDKHKKSHHFGRRRTSKDKPHLKAKTKPSEEKAKVASDGCQKKQALPTTSKIKKIWKKKETSEPTVQPSGEANGYGEKEEQEEEGQPANQRVLHKRDGASKRLGPFKRRKTMARIKHDGLPLNVHVPIVEWTYAIKEKIFILRLCNENYMKKSQMEMLSMWEAFAEQDTGFDELLVIQSCQYSTPR